MTKDLLLTLKVRLEYEREIDYKEVTGRKHLGFSLKFMEKNLLRPEQMLFSIYTLIENRNQAPQSGFKYVLTV